MTLRVTFDIVPFGEETHKRNIGVLSINNQGGNGPFCTYAGKLEYNSEEYAYSGVKHDRRQGAIKLLQKVLTQLTIDHPTVEDISRR